MTEWLVFAAAITFGLLTMILIILTAADADDRDWD